MKTNRELMTALAAIALSFALTGWTPSDVVYFTNIERQEDGSRIAMPPDNQGMSSITGRVRSNDTLLFYGGGRYPSTYYSAQDTYLVVGDGQPQFNPGVHLGMDYLHMGENLNNIRAAASPYITDGHGRLMTWIRLEGDAGIRIFQYPLGSVRSESLYMSQGPPNWQAIFVDGQCEIEGTLTGQLTIGSSGDMWLIDDVRYTNADTRTGDFNENDPTVGILGLASASDIIIKDNFRNGKENGIAVAAGDWNRHSIVITAMVICPNGSFTFEHQNNDWEMYQGPDPDERGIIFMKGSLIQNRRGLLHTSNHNGTGYGLMLRYDSRFERRPPAYIGNGFLDDGRYKTLWGDINDIDLDSEHVYYVGEAYIRDLTILPEYHIIFHSSSLLTVQRTLNILGREDAPAHLQVNPDQESGGELIFAGRGRNSVRIEHAVIDPGITMELTSDTISIANSDLGGSLELSGNLSLAHSTLRKGVSLGRPGRGRIERCLLFDGLTVANWGWDLAIVNNTIVGASMDAIRLESGAGIRVVNNIITSSRNGIACDGNERPHVGYNLLFDIQSRPYYGCGEGDGALRIDPLFVSPRREDYHLQAGSPCLDAGDPDSPRDPDGTRADIGAFWFDQGLGNDADDDDFPPCSQEGNRRGGLSASPNPFNASTVIRFKDGYGYPSSLRIIDLAGREVYSSATPLRVAERKTADHRGSAEEGGGGYGAPSSLRIFDLVGREVPSSVNPQRVAERKTADHRGSAEEGFFTWDASAFPAGIYIVRYANGISTHSIKLVKVD